MDPMLPTRLTPSTTPANKASEFFRATLIFKLTRVRGHDSEGNTGPKQTPSGDCSQRQASPCVHETFM
jgi:hypothetical protein